MNISVFRNSLGQAGYFSTDPRAVRERCENGARTAFDGLDGREPEGFSRGGIRNQPSAFLFPTRSLPVSFKRRSVGRL